VHVPDGSSNEENKAYFTAIFPRVGVYIKEKDEIDWDKATLFAASFGDGLVLYFSPKKGWMRNKILHFFVCFNVEYIVSIPNLAQLWPSQLPNKDTVRH